MARAQHFSKTVNGAAIGKTRRPRKAAARPEQGNSRVRAPAVGPIDTPERVALARQAIKERIARLEELAASEDTAVRWAICYGMQPGGDPSYVAARAHSEGKSVTELCAEWYRDLARAFPSVAAGRVKAVAS